MASVFGHDLEALVEGGNEALTLLRRKAADAVAGTTLISRQDLYKLYTEFQAMQTLVKELSEEIARKDSTPDE